MFNPMTYENSRPDGIGVLEIVNGTRPQEGRPRQFVPLKRTELRGEVAGPLAALRLSQVYGYSREQCDRVLEAVYRFPLPGDAAVTRVRVRFGEVEIRAELQERRQAEAGYEEAKRQGRQAALLTRESPNVFTLQVAGIQPGQEVTVETSYVQLARAEGPGWSMRIPLTTAPRFLRSDELTSRHAQGQPLLLLRDPGHRFSLDLTLQGAEVVESPTHRLEMTAEDDRLRVRLQESEVLPDRDCVLSWQPRREPDRPALQVLLHHEPASEQVYFLALVAPPAVRDPGRNVPREVVLLVDHSSSMEGAKREAADWAVKRFLSDLTERDAFSLGLFHDRTRWFSRTPRRADTKAIEEGIRFLEAHRDSGGTELGVALEQALGLEREEGEHARHVLIITDAQVTDAGRILRLASQESQRTDRRRISLLCIDAAPNSFLARELAERGGGIARFLTSAPEEEDIATALDEVLADWAEPVLVGLRLEVNRPEVQAAGREGLEVAEASWSAIDLGDLPAGRALWVAGRAPRGEGTDLAFRVRTARNREVTACRLELAGEAGEHPAIKALFGARRVLGLEFLIHSGHAGEELQEQLGRLGYDPKEVLAGRPGVPPKVYAENVRADAETALRELLVREALQYGLACSETAFIAVRTEAGRPVEGSVVVANALPVGWSENFLSRGGSSPRAYRAAALFAVAEELDIPAFLRRSGPPSDLVESSFDAAAGALDQPGEGDPHPLRVRSFMGSKGPEPSSASFSSRFRTKKTADRPGEKTPVLFSGVPQFVGGEAVLFDSSREQDTNKLPDRATLSHFTVRLPGAAPKRGGLDPGLSLLIFVGDLSSPRARMRLVDVVRQRGERPLNLLKLPGQVVRIVLLDPAGAWARSAPQIEVALGWKAMSSSR